VPAHSYALFLRERREGGMVFALKAIRTESPQAVAALGTELDVTRDKTYIAVCAEQRQRQYLSDIAPLGIALSKLGYYRTDARDVPVRSYFVYPIMNDDEVVAVLAVDSLEAGAFSIEDQDNLVYFAPFFLQIIEKIMLALDLKARAEHFGGLHEISTALNSSLKFGEIMNAVLPKIRMIVPFDLCACLLAGEQDGHSVMTFTALHGYDGEPFLGRSFPLEGSPILAHMRKHWQDQEILKYYTADFGDRGRDIGLFPFKELQRPIRSMYGRLLAANDVLLGAFFLASFSPDAFTAYHRDVLLDTLMNQVSQVAYNSLLFQRIEGMARTDGLTGLLNHRTFMEKLREKYKELSRSPRPFSVLLMDIDKFKGVNDKYGHPVGDVAIKAVARVLAETARSSDFAARYGGEEFAVGMVDTDSRGAEQMAERMRKIMEQTVVTRVADGELKVTLSIGVASYPADTDDPSELVALSDEALYHAKRSGRNRVSLHRDAVKSPLPAGGS
jgi:diguanylate cyclase (GGDEF)-like protein